MSPRFFVTNRLLPVIEQWPEGDRKAFLQAAGAGRGPFARVRNARSLHATRSGYARYLRYLDDSGQLDPHELPCHRVSLERLDGYIEHLQERDNADLTIINRFEQLQKSLSLMFPRQDFRWVTRPRGASLRKLLTRRRKTVVPIDSAVLLAWAEDLFAEGLTARTRSARHRAVRDAVLLGILAERAPRLRALSMLRLGDSLKRGEEVWLLREHAEMMKTRAPHHMPLSVRVSRMLDRYVAVERQELLAHKPPTSAAWIGRSGELTANAIFIAVREQFFRHFGRREGPHFFRHCLATTLADRMPEHPLDAAAVLAHSRPETTIEHYNHANKVGCALRVEAMLEKLRSDGAQHPKVASPLDCQAMAAVAQA